MSVSRSARLNSNLRENGTASRREGKREKKRESFDKSDKIGENKKGNRVRQKRRVKFIHKKENYYEQSGGARLPQSE